MVYGYARVSTKGQAKNGNSLEDQRAKLLEAGVSEEGIYTDSYTGTTIHRPEFDKLMAVLKSGDTLVVCKLDRFARTAPEGANLIRDLVNRGIRVNVLNMGTADNTTMGKMMITILLAFAEFERDNIAERTAAGKAWKRANDPNYREGRKRLSLPDFPKISEKQKRGEISVDEACSMLGVCRSTYYKRLRGA